MTCPMCNYDWCWVCGLAKKSIFHRVQRYEGETGFTCELVNKVTQKLKCLPYPVSFLLALLVLLVCPILGMIPVVLIGAPIVIVKTKCGPVRGSKWFSLVWCLLIVIVIPTGMALIAVGYSVALALYYLVVPLLVFVMLLRMLIYHCFKHCRSTVISYELKRQIETNQ